MLKYLELVTPLMMIGVGGLFLVEIFTHPFQWWSPLAFIGAVFVIVYFVACAAMVLYRAGGKGGLWSDESDDFGGE